MLSKSSVVVLSHVIATMLIFISPSNEPILVVWVVKGEDSALFSCLLHKIMKLNSLFCYFVNVLFLTVLSMHSIFFIITLDLKTKTTNNKKKIIWTKIVD